MSFTDVCRNFACGLGRFVGGSFSAFGSVGKALRGLWPRSSRERIRSIVIEELIRLAGKEAELTGTKLEERLQVMAETIEAIQKRILELSGRGLENEALVSAAMASVENVSLLNDEEKVILTNIFRQNVAIQKPELVDNAV